MQPNISMNNLLDTKPTSTTPLSRKLSRPLKLIYILNWLLIISALLAGTLLLLSDLLPFSPIHAPSSAAPLLLIGSAYLTFQILNSPGWLDLLKSFIVSAAFLLWGIDQLLPPGRFATTLGDVVIVLYVIDLAWMMLDRLKARKTT